VQSKTKTALAKAIETTPDGLILITECGKVSIPWEKCSQALANASPMERKRADLSPSGYGIHWPLIDEDLAVGPLLQTVHSASGVHGLADPEPVNAKDIIEQPLMLKTKYISEDLAHRLLWRIVEENAQLAGERAEGSFYPALVSQVFAFHTIEAYLNFVGERVSPEIWKDERNYFRNEPYRGFEGKLRKVMELVGLTMKPEEPPLSTVTRLKRLRDLIAHGKSERFAGEQIHTASAPRPPILPPSTLRKAVAPREELLSILPEVEALLNDIHRRAAPIVEELWANTDTAIWFGQEALRGPGQFSSGLTTLHSGH
jgi:hypothetical protein